MSARVGRKNRSVPLSLAWLILMFAAACLAPAFLSEKAQLMDSLRVLEPPSLDHWFGTDALGRDLFSRVLCGTSVSLTVGLSVVALSLAIGVAAGAAAGYYGGLVDRVVTAVVNILLCFPTFFLILAVVAILGPDILHMVWILSLTGWMASARLVRAEVMSLKERDFVLAARTLGAGSSWIIRKHLIPGAARPALVNGVLSIAGVILMESGLSFLGLGVQPPVPSWGNILTDGKMVLGVAWWVTLFPGLFIFLTVLSFNLLGEALARSYAGTREAA